MSRLIYKEPVKQSVFSSHLSSREPRPRAQSIIAYNDVCHELRAMCQAYASLRLTWRIHAFTGWAGGVHPTYEVSLSEGAEIKVEIKDHSIETCRRVAWVQSSIFWQYFLMLIF